MLAYNTLSFALAVACGILFIIEMIYFWGPYSRIHRACKKHAEDQPESDCPPISVIIVTKDSGQALKENLPAVLEQDYPFFEVIVVNDESVGEDEDILKEFEKQYHNLYHTFIPGSARYISTEKLGISMGLKACKHKWVVVTDPYSRPVSKNWLRSLSKHFTAETEIVLGYSNYTTNHTSFGRQIIADTLFNSMRYMGKALGGKAYMGIGHNLAYRKDTYELHKGFSNQITLRRGEDDLFVNTVANEHNTKVALEPDSVVRMTVPPFRRIWKEEKISYAVTGHYYKGHARACNSFETWCCALFHWSVLGGIVLTILESQWILLSAIILLGIIRFASVMNVFHQTAKDMGEDLKYYLPFYDFFRPWYSYRAKVRYYLRTKADYIRK